MAGTIKHEWNGTVLTITSDSGTSSANLKGDKGDDGARGAQGAPGGCYAEDSPKLGGVAASEYATKNYAISQSAPYNLLDNSYFPSAYVINQRGQTSYSGMVYMIDRWKGSAADIEVKENCVSVTRGTRDYAILAQFITKIEEGKTYTLAAQNTAGEIICLTYTATVGMSNKSKAFSMAGHQIIARYSSASNMHYVGFANTTDTALEIVWAALYEGTYTKDTLPAYHYKGYAAELLECQRYYIVTNGQGYGYCASTSTVRLNIPIPSNMRIKPTIEEGLTFRIYCAGTKQDTTGYEVNKIFHGMVQLTLSGSFTSNECITAYATTPFGFSADL